jgi:hypothetical protein
MPTHDNIDIITSKLNCQAEFKNNFIFILILTNRFGWFIIVCVRQPLLSPTVWGVPGISGLSTPCMIGFLFWKGINIAVSNIKQGGNK